MIDKNNFKTLLTHLKFKEENEVFSKTINEATLKIDFEKEQIIYPEEKDLKVNERQICNFSSNENFVVFECVHRLLEKGYQPKHLEIEPKWKLGHGASGGRADILVKDREEKSLLIIECKTWGEEYDKEKNKMLANGGQLFSYYQQEKSTRYLCLYTSNFEKKIIYENAIIKTIDREEDKKAFEDGDKKIKLYEKAKNNKEVFEVWKETFNCYFHYNGIFENDINAYEIELKPLKKKDLKAFPEANKIFNTFMEILRHNNISDNANAFNRFLSLLLCKIVDEEKGPEQILDFQVKEGEDTPEKIQDRLQKLYAKGMGEHLDQEIVYFEDEKIKEIIKLYPKETPIEEIETIFKQIKYYTQNEFALKEVHNEELFLQNAKVLNEVIKMLQNFRFRYTKKQQFLGDFFELLLNHGVKQNEGQFFTPVPIVRFMILSLGLDKIVEKKLAKGEKDFLPKILDYACGAGHFLTESIDEIQKFIDKFDATEIEKNNLEKSNKENIFKNTKKYKESTEWAKDYIYGIEKDYRLARTSQIACFLNGDGDANILYGDGLENHKKLNLKKGKNLFDIILSNPPYSIKSFKNYLNVGEKEFTLSKNLTQASKEIENLFVERTAQLLKNGGRAGIILPSSILSNDSDLHFETRKILLENFHIKGVASFGSGTFGATGTNTVILFLEKRSPDFSEDRRLFAEEIFANIKTDKSYLDRERLLKMFLAYRNLNIEDYRSLIFKIPNENMLKSSLYKNYWNWFEDLTEIKKLKKSDSFKKSTPEEQQEELKKKFYEKVLPIEQQKFYFFMLTLKDDYRKKETKEEAYKHQQTAIVQSGEKDKAKSFLGYEFSNRKGGEGIKINRNEKGHAINKMCEEENHHNLQKANSYVLKSFNGEEINFIDEEIKEHVKVARLSDMLDFEKIELNNTISFNPKISNEIGSKWELVRLEEVLENIESGNRPKGGVGNINEGILSLGGEHIHPNNGNILLNNPKYVSLEFYDNSNKGKLKENDILICKDGALTGKIALLKEELQNQKAMVNEHVFILRCNNLETQKYTFNFLFSQKGQNLLKQNITGSAQGGLNSTNLKNIKIPLPPLDIQQKIVSECEAIDQEVAQANQQINTCKSKIETEIEAVVRAGYEMKDLEKICEDIFAGGDVPKDNFSKIKNDIFNIPIFSNSIENKGLYGYTNKARVKKPSITISARGTIGHVELRQLPFYPIIRLIVVIPKEDIMLLDYLKLSIKNTQISQSGGVIPQLTVPMVKNIKIPVPPLDIQKKLVQKVKILEQKINQAQSVVDGAKDRKEEVLKREL